jgi:hypothetical protein
MSIENCQYRGFLINFSNIVEHNVLDMNIHSIYFRFMIKNILDKVDISSRHFSYLLNGDRNATPATAIQIERATGIPKELWVFGSALERKTAWENFLKQQNDS